MNFSQPHGWRLTLLLVAFNIAANTIVAAEQTPKPEALPQMGTQVDTLLETPLCRFCRRR